MKRSFINEIIKESDAFIRSFGYLLPPFAYFTPDEMKQRRSDIQSIIDARLGWDITDYAEGHFDTLGLFLFTVRNSTFDDLNNARGMLYAEKIMISRKEQVTPMHRHIVKTEDIINRGGGKLAVKLYTCTADGEIDHHSDVLVLSDGISRSVAPGGILRLYPGESVTLSPNIWHAFWAEEQDVLIGEVSTVNDDLTDNIFAKKLKRFSSIQEDCRPSHLLVSDYSNPTWFE